MNAMENTTDSFVIGGTDFGIDSAATVASITTHADGSRVLNLDVQGDEKTYRSVSESEDSKWSWTLYPPRFYLSGYEFAFRGVAENLEIALTSNDYEDYDVGLYMMEHNEVSDVVIKFHADEYVSVVGRVDLMGDDEAFEIHCHVVPMTD
jgi:hypothetical protein